MWQRYFPSLLLQLLISKQIGMISDHSKLFTLIGIRLHQETIQFSCGISLVALKHYISFNGIWEDCIALPH